MSNNGDTHRRFAVGAETISGIGSFHKTLPHNKYGEVCPEAFEKLVQATEGNASFADVPKGATNSAPFVNPRAGLAADQLTRHPATYDMPPAPTVLSTSTAAEMVELYWMALLRDVPFDQFDSDPRVKDAAAEISKKFKEAVDDSVDPGHLKKGIDVPGSTSSLARLTPKNIFRIGLPGEEDGPLVSQLFLRNIGFGTQTIDQKQLPYATGCNFLTKFPDWLSAQDLGRDGDGLAYPQGNQGSEKNFDRCPRYISTMRDLARFVHKDALHQAYFNGALLLLSGEAEWTPGNPYGTDRPLAEREAGFGTLGGPHILALVSEVATRALKIVWNQKWQVNLRLRPEAYGGLIHVQNLGVGQEKRHYGLPEWLTTTKVIKEIHALNRGTYLLPMAFTSGSPTHPAYGAGHATVAGACVTVLKAWFKTYECVNGRDMPIPLGRLLEKLVPYGKGEAFTAFDPGVDSKKMGTLTPLSKAEAGKLTIEGELNKLASNVAMGRTMGGVHWRSDNTRSLMLGEAIASGILAEITTDLSEECAFEFRSFSRDEKGYPKKILIKQGRVRVNGVLVDSHSSAL